MYQRCSAALGAILLALGVAGDARGENHTAIITESVNVYTTDAGCCNGPPSCPCNTCGNICNSNNDANGFWNGMLNGSNPAGFTADVQWFDSNVWDSDFMDPELAGDPCNKSVHACDDTDEFDNTSGLGISFYAGHGNTGVSNGVVSGACQSETDCGSYHAPAGTTVGRSGWGACVKSPASYINLGSGWGYCVYTPTPATAGPLITVHGSSVSNNNNAPLANMALGETPTVGNWGGANTNGGTSLAIVHMSFGMLTWFPLSEWQSIFAGTQLYAGIMVSYGDARDTAVFGTNIAQAYVANEYSAVKDGYTNAITLDNSGSCGNDGSPGGGFNGCGCHTIMTVSATNTGAWDTFNFEWYQLKYDDPYQTGSGYWYYQATCNYNPSTYPWSGGL